MQSLILCEGGTDLTLIQYYMRVANFWEDGKENNKFLKLKLARELKKQGNKLTIGAVGGCSQITNNFNKAILRNTLSSQESFKKLKEL